jgi:hypothetical protein
VDALKRKAVLLKLAEVLTGSENPHSERIGYLVRKLRDPRTPEEHKVEIREELRDLEAKVTARKKRERHVMDEMHTLVSLGVDRKDDASERKRERRRKRKEGGEVDSSPLGTAASSAGSAVGVDGNEGVEHVTMETLATRHMGSRSGSVASKGEAGLLVSRDKESGRCHEGGGSVRVTDLTGLDRDHGHIGHDGEKEDGVSDPTRPCGQEKGGGVNSFVRPCGGDGERGLPEQVLEVTQDKWPYFKEVFMLSALNGDGVDKLKVRRRRMLLSQNA